MDGPDRRRGLRALSVRWRLAAAAVALAVLAFFVVDLVADRGGGPTTTNAVPAASATPPAQEVRRIHAILHGIDRVCSRGPSDREREQLGQDAGVLVRFSQRYPRARFQIDDETGRALTLLLVARQALLTCAPDAAARIDRALPEEFRKGL